MTSAQPDASKSSTRAGRRTPRRVLFMILGALAGTALVGVLIVVFALAMAYPNLPALDTLTDYRPKMPLRIFSADNVLIGEFGEERRNMVHIKDIPEVMKKAVETAAAVFAEKGVKLKIGVYANAFEADADDSAANEGLHETRKDLTDDAYSRFACNWADAGASFIGGCCGIGAAHIHTLAGVLRGR